MTPIENSENEIKAIGTTLEIIEYIKDNNGARIQEISENTGLTPSTIHRHLNTLRSHGYTIKENGEYTLSFRFVEIGEFVRGRKKAFELAEETVHELAESTEERAQYFVEEHGQAVYVCFDTGKHGVKTDAYIGRRVPLHATGGGKAILANLPEHRIHEVLEQQGLPKLTEHTITDETELLEELETIRERGYSFNKQEYSLGSRAVGAPVIDNTGELLGAISVTGPTLRMKDEWFNRELPDLLMGVANELALNISYQ